MPNGFPGFRQSRFPNDLPPTLFHPASPKVKPAKPIQEVDTMSIITTSSFASTDSLLKIKESMKAKLLKRKEPTQKKESPKDSRSSTGQTVNAFMVNSLAK